MRIALYPPPPQTYTVILFKPVDDLIRVREDLAAHAIAVGHNRNPLLANVVLENVLKPVATALSLATTYSLQTRKEEEYETEKVIQNASRLPRGRKEFPAWPHLDMTHEIGDTLRILLL